MNEEGIEEQALVDIGRRSGKARKISFDSVVQIGTVVVSMVGSLFVTYINFHDRMVQTEMRLNQVEKSQGLDKAETEKQLDRINNKLDQLISNQIVNRPDMRGYMK